MTNVPACRGAGGVDNGGGHARVGREGIRNISAPSTQFSCEPKKAKPKTNLSLFFFSLYPPYIWKTEEERKVRKGQRRWCPSIQQFKGLAVDSFFLPSLPHHLFLPLSLTLSVSLLHSSDSTFLFSPLDQVVTSADPRKQTTVSTGTCLPGLSLP